MSNASSSNPKTAVKQILQTPANQPSPPAVRENALWLNGGTAILDSKNNVVTVNDALAAWLGNSRNELTKLSFLKLVAQRSAEWEKPLAEFLEGGAEFDRLELIGHGEQGSQKVRVELCRHGDTKFVRMESALPLSLDLEGISPAEKLGSAATHEILNRLLRAEAQLDNLTYNWPGIIFSQRPDFSFVFVSPRIEALTGVPAAEWRRQSNYFWRVVHESDAAALRNRLKDIKNSADGITSTYRVRNIQTGRVSYLWEHRQAVYTSNGLLIGYEGIWLDITRQTIAERRLLRMAWKENLGTLTMGLAHDFCNLMTGIVTMTDSLKKDFNENDSLRGNLDLIGGSAMQAGELAQRIQQFQQGSLGQKNYHDLNQIIGNLAALLQKLLTRRVKVQVNLTGSQLPVYVDEVELRQVAINFALNAVDAMPSGGTLTLRTSRHEQAPNEKPLQGTFPRAPLICFSVQDTGTGIPPEFLSSIFDPYFTTKPFGKGSGLGLYNARLFAESHEAAITVETSTAGTTFHLWFAQTDFTETQEPPSATPPARQTLLVTGATEESRNRMVELLRANHFYAVSVASPKEAIEAIHSPDYQFSGVLVLARHPKPEKLSLLRHIRAERLPIKTFLSPENCDLDEFNTSFLVNVDATLPQEMPAKEFIAALKSFLSK